MADLTAKGELGPASLKSVVLFCPLAPAFLYTLSEASLTVLGTDFTFYSAMVGPNAPPHVFTGGPSGGMAIKASRVLSGIKTSAVVGFGARITDFQIGYSGVGTYTKTFPVDPFPGGLTFTYLELSAKNVPLCCGMTLDLSFSFTKDGFDKLVATLKTIPICCGITLDAKVAFTTTSKTVELKPKWAGIEGCLTVYGDVNFTAPNLIQGIEIYGFKVRCELVDCNYLEILTAFNVAKIEEILEEDIFKGAEFQYAKLGFCGPGCCGGKWSLEIAGYFVESGPLFGLNRLGLEAEVPLMVNFSLRIALKAVSGAASLGLGWVLAF